MPRRTSPFIPKDLRSRLEIARLDTLALIRALDQALAAPSHLPQPHTQELFELDADCAEALWTLDRPPGSLDFKAMVHDTTASLDQLADAREQVRSHLRPPDRARVLQLEPTIRERLNRREAYNDVPGRDPQIR